MREQHATETVTQDITMACVDAAAGTVTTLKASLGYQPSDPFAVTATFITAAGDVVWTFARELLARGLTDSAGHGDVHIWPCLDTHGRAVMVIELSSSAGELIAQARTQDVYRFVSRTLASVLAGTEGDIIDMDQLIDQLLSDAS